MLMALMQTKLNFMRLLAIHKEDPSFFGPEKTASYAFP